MRKLITETHCEPAESTDCENLTQTFFGDDGIDVDMLLFDTQKASDAAQYTQKSFSGWTSLALRSLHGMTGENASDASGEHASADPAKFEDTPAMQPYIKHLVETVASQHSGLLKVRLMKMKAGSSIGEHRDKFCGHEDAVLRYHIPIVTHPKVTFYVSRVPYHLKCGELYRMNVSKLHSVVNASHDTDRIHLVFDVAKNLG